MLLDAAVFYEPTALHLSQCISPSRQRYAEFQDKNITADSVDVKKFGHITRWEFLIPLQAGRCYVLRQ